jgi:hypothetical protein
MVPTSPWPAARPASSADLGRPAASHLAAVLGWFALAAGLAVFPLLATAMVLDRRGLAGHSGIGFGGWGGGPLDGWFDYALVGCILASHLGGITAQILDRGRRQWGARAIGACWLALLLGFPLDLLVNWWLR